MAAELFGDPVPVGIDVQGHLTGFPLISAMTSSLTLRVSSAAAAWAAMTPSSGSISSPSPGQSMKLMVSSTVLLDSGSRTPASYPDCDSSISSVRMSFSRVSACRNDTL